MTFDISQIEFSKNDLNSNISLPNNITTNLAEFIGIIVVDGNLGFYQGKLESGKCYVSYQIRISGNINEMIYLDHVNSIFQSIFNTKLHYHRDHGINAILLRKQSKAIQQFLIKQCGLKLNRKTESASIPV